MGGSNCVVGGGGVVGGAYLEQFGRKLLEECMHLRGRNVLGGLKDRGKEIIC